MRPIVLAVQRIDSSMLSMDGLSLTPSLASSVASHRIMRAQSRANLKGADRSHQMSERWQTAVKVSGKPTAKQIPAAATAQMDDAGLKASKVASSNKVDRVAASKASADSVPPGATRAMAPQATEASSPPLPAHGEVLAVGKAQKTADAPAADVVAESADASSISLPPAEDPTQADDADVRRATCEAFGRLNKPELLNHATDLITMLADPDESVRRAAVDALLALEPAQLAPYGAALVAKSKHQTWGVRLVAVEALGWLEPGALQAHAAAVTARLHDGEAHVRRAACEALGGVVSQHVDSLEPLLLDAQWHVRRAAVEALGKLGDNALQEERWQLALEARRSGDSDDRVRRAAAEVLAGM